MPWDDVTVDIMAGVAILVLGVIFGACGMLLWCS